MKEEPADTGLPIHFRKLSPAERRKAFLNASGVTGVSRAFLEESQPDVDFADLMTENSAGFFELPLGIAQGLVVNGVSYDVPLATEEPSVVAAASYAARLLCREGGFTASADEPVMLSQVFLEGCAPDATGRFAARKPEIEAAARETLASMEKRGGGLRFVEWHFHRKTGLHEARFGVDTRDAMGANLLNTLAEGLSPLLSEITGGKKLMAILSNDGSRRLARASFNVGAASLAKPGFSGAEICRRVALAAELARECPERAVTHNKGIMNGVSALALATGNDTRALEAAVHCYASRDGAYRGITQYRLEDGRFFGDIELPAPLAAVGGAVTFHPAAKASLGLLGNPDARTLAGIAAALGLAQNFAALYALTGEGIQKGHMALHERRKNWEKRGN